MKRGLRSALRRRFRFGPELLGVGALAASAALVAVACSSGGADGSSSSSDQALAGTGPLTPSEIAGGMTCGATVPAAYTGATTYMAYSFPGTKGESVNIWVRGSAGADAEAWLLRSDFSELSSNDNASTGVLDSNILAVLPKTQTYYIAFKEKHGKAATFNVSLACAGAAIDAGGGGTDAGKGGTDAGKVDSGGGCPNKCTGGQSCVSGQCEYTSCTGIQVPGDYATIADALVVIPSGGTICLAAQSYPESVTVSSPGTVIIQGISSALTSVTGITSTSGPLSLAGLQVGTVTAGGAATVTNAALDFATLAGTATVTASAMTNLGLQGSATVTDTSINSLNVTIAAGPANVLLNGLELGTSLVQLPSNGAITFVLENSYVTGQFATTPGEFGPSSGSIALLDNTFVGPGVAQGIAMSFGGAGTTTLQYFNNIVTSFDIGIDIQGTFGTTTSGYNALYDLTTRYAGSAVVGPGYVLTNPMLDTSTTPPGLLPGSPCLGAGDATHAPATDFWGNARSATYEDIGAVSGPAGNSGPPPVPTYFPTGPQTNVPTSALVGWTQCYQDLYDVNLNTVVSTIQANCNQGHILMACGPVGSSTYELLAAGARADVFTETGNGNASTTHIANGVGWYFDPSWSWGFVPAGDTPTLDECDTNTTTDDGLRLCWHTISASGGYRCGSDISLNTSTAFARYVFQSP